MSEISERIRKIVADKFEVDIASLGPETGIATDLGADGLDIVELSLAFVSEFNIEMTDADVEELTTLSDAEKFISDRV